MPRSSKHPVTAIVEFFRTEELERAELVYGLIRDVMIARRPVKVRKPVRKPRAPRKIVESSPLHDPTTPRRRRVITGITPLPDPSAAAV